MAVTFYGLGDMRRIRILLSMFLSLLLVDWNYGQEKYEQNEIDTYIDVAWQRNSVEKVSIF